MPFQRTYGAHRRTAGFTLMELLVAITLLGMLMVVLFGSLRFGTRVWEASDRVLSDDGDMVAIRGFLQDRLEQSLPVTLYLADGREEIVFAGEQTSLRFASTMPESFGFGPFVMDLALRPSEDRDDGRDLALRWRLIDEAREPQAGDVDRRVILPDLAALSFAYFGVKEDGDTAPAWHASWTGQPRLPDLIRMEFGFGNGDQRHWPPLIVSPRVDEWYDTAF